MGTIRDDSRRLDNIYDDPYQPTTPEDEERVRLWFQELKNLVMPPNVIVMIAGPFHQKDFYATIQRDTKENVCESKKERKDIEC
jgi:hypothetical protein